MTPSTNVKALGDKVTEQDTAAGGVTLTNYAGQIYIGWTGTDPDHHLNVGQIKI